MNTKEVIAIERILTFKPDSLAFSGGKDSAVIDFLMRKSGLPYTGFMNLTTVDPKIHLDFVRANYPHIELIHPEKGLSMYALIVKKGLPSRKFRWCCEYLKERIVKGSFVVMGVRWAESKKRQTRPMFHFHPRHKGVKVLNPIIDWSDRDVWDYITANNIPISPLYKEPYNLNRVGCVGCPVAGSRVTKEFRLFPEFRRYYISAIAQRMKQGKFQEFGTAERVFEWWINQTSKAEYLAQMSFCMDN